MANQNSCIQEDIEDIFSLGYDWSYVYFDFTTHPGYFLVALPKFVNREEIDKWCRTEFGEENFVSFSAAHICNDEVSKYVKNWNNTFKRKVSVQENLIPKEGMLYWFKNKEFAIHFKLRY